MNMELLLALYDRIADAPDAIVRLRRFILDLAVRGKLVPQDPEDGSASELLKRIAEERARLVKVGEIGKEKPLPELHADELPFKLSRRWKWVRLERLAWKITDGEHLSPNKTTSGMPLLTAVHVAARGLTLNNPQFVSMEDGLKFRLRCDPRRGDILICSRGTIGRCAVVNVDDTFCLMGSVIQIRLPPECSPSYFNYFLSTDRAQQQMRGMSGATAVQALYLKDIRRCPMPLPPRAEQTRIVAKVDELMALCDRLEVSRAKREATRDRLAGASLARLNSPDPDPAAFAGDAGFALNSLAAITTRADHVKQLRQTILNLAVRGKLVPQDPNEESASNLLKVINAEKARLVRDEKIRDIPSTAETRTSKFVGQLPHTWRSVTISEIAYLRSGIALEPGEEQAEGDIPYVKVADLSLMENAKGIATSSRFVGRSRKDAVIESGSIIFPKRGGAIATNRKRISIVNVVCDSNLMAMKPFMDGLRPYLEMWFSSFDLWTLNSGTSVPQINNKDIYPLAVPLPPLAEQHRIVAKVDELMALCERLEARLNDIDATRRLLLDALLAEALAAAEAREDAAA